MELLTTELFKEFYKLSHYLKDVNKINQKEMKHLQCFSLQIKIEE
jgi:hypothetical protein